MTVQELHTKLGEYIREGKGHIPVYFGDRYMSLPINKVSQTDITEVRVVKLSFDPAKELEKHD
jgi:hypothetical protein